MTQKHFLSIFVITTVILLVPIFIPSVHAIEISEGALIRAIGDIDVWIVKYVGSKKFKRLVLSPHVFNSYGHLHWEDVIDVDQSVVDSFTTSNLVRATVAGDPKVFMLYPAGDTGEKRWIPSVEIFNAWGFDWDSIYTINEIDRDAYITGEPLSEAVLEDLSFSEDILMGLRDETSYGLYRLDTSSGSLTSIKEGISFSEIYDTVGGGASYAWGQVGGGEDLLYPNRLVDISHTRDKIVYTDNDGVWIMNSDGGNLTNIIETSETDRYYFQPRISSDGNKVAVLFPKLPLFFLYYQLAIVNIDGSNYKEIFFDDIGNYAGIVKGNYTALNWFPDSSNLTVSTISYSDLTMPDGGLKYGVWKIDSSDGSKEKLFDSNEKISQSTLLNGSKIVFANLSTPKQWSAYPSHVAVSNHSIFDIGTKTTTDLSYLRASCEMTNLVMDGMDMALAFIFSPDGSKFSTTPCGDDLYIPIVDSQNPAFPAEQFTVVNNNLISDWSSDGEYLLTVDSHGIALLNVDKFYKKYVLATEDTYPTFFLSDNPIGFLKR